MVHVRIALDWGYAAKLAERAGPVGRALEQLAGVLTIEVEGVDLTRGRADGALLPMLESLLRGLARLQAGGRRAAVPLGDGGLLLLIQRRDAQAVLTLFELGPPSCPLVRDLEVDLGGLAAAGLQAAADLCQELDAVRPGGPAASRRLRGLSRGVAVPGRTPTAHPPAPRNGRATAAPSPSGTVRCEVALDDEGEPLALEEGEPAGLASLLASGRVVLTVPAGPPEVVEGAPFLTLRDLIAALEASAAALRRREPVGDAVLRRPGRALPLAIRLGPVRGAVARPPTAQLQASPLELAEAAAIAVESFAELAAAAGQTGNPLLEDLRQRAQAARDHLAELTLGDAQLASAPAPKGSALAATTHRPLARGALRRIVLRIQLEAHVGQPIGPGLLMTAGTALVLGREAVLGLAPKRRWASAGADWGGLAGGLLVLRRGDRLVGLELASGRPRWERSLPAARPTGLAGGPTSPILLGEPGAVTALEPLTGQVAWRLELPGGSGLALASFGALLVAAADTGLVYAVAADGQLAWRLRGPGPALAPPLLVGGLLATLHAAGPAAAVLLLDPRSGGRRGQVDLDVLPSGGPVRLGTGLAVAGRSGGEAVLVRVDPRRGRTWEVGVPLGGPARLSRAGRALLAADDAGGLALVEGSGRLAWSLPPDGSEGGATPVLARGVVVAARGGLALIESSTGQLLAQATRLSPARLVADRSLAITVLEADGAVTRLEPGGHLSVLDGAR